MTEAGELVYAIYVAFRAHVNFLAPAGSGRAEVLDDESRLSDCPYQSHRVCLHHCLDDRLLPVIPPLLLDADLLGPLAGHDRGVGDVPVSVQFRQRLRRALGSLPRDTAARQREPALLSSPAVVTRRGQFGGDYTVCTWNSQALFASDPRRHAAKAEYVSRLMQKTDILLLTETHGTEVTRTRTKTRTSTSR